MRPFHIVGGLGCLFFFSAGTLLPATTQVIVDLGQSSQNYVEYGLGANSMGQAVWDLEQGACSFSGGTTTCTLSGNYTGTSAGFTGGTYSFVTSYSGINQGALKGVSEASPNQNYFQYSSADSSLSMVLDLTTNGITVSETLVSGGHFTPTVNGINFVYTSYSCSGAAVAGGCSPFDVGITNGAIGQGPVTGAVNFNATITPTTTPEPRWGASLGLALFAGSATWLRRKKARRQPLGV